MTAEEGSLLVAAHKDEARARRLTPLLAAVALSAVAVYSRSSEHRTVAGGAPSEPSEELPFQQLAALRQLDDDDDDDDDDYDDDYDGLYDCTNGVPSVAEAYKDGSWGSIYDDWYVIAGNMGRSNPSSGDCCRMTFNYREDSMNQHMMYTRGDVDYFWNYTGNTASATGVWENTGMSMYSDFWSTVALADTYNGHRYFVWYFCGPAVSVTRRGIPWVLADDYALQSDDTFTSYVEEQLNDLGLLKAGNFTTFVQEASCDYTWHHTGGEIE